MHAVGEHLAAKYYFDQAISSSIDESTIVRNNQDNDFNIYNLNNKNGIFLNTQVDIDNQFKTKSCVEQFRQEN